jgi:hypothetical protein
MCLIALALNLLPYDQDLTMDPIGGDWLLEQMAAYSAMQTTQTWLTERILVVRSLVQTALAEQDGMVTGYSDPLFWQSMTRYMFPIPLDPLYASRLSRGGYLLKSSTALTLFMTILAYSQEKIALDPSAIRDAAYYLTYATRKQLFDVMEVSAPRAEAVLRNQLNMERAHLYQRLGAQPPEGEMSFVSTWTLRQTDAEYSQLVSAHYFSLARSRQTLALTSRKLASVVWMIAVLNRRSLREILSELIKLWRSSSLMSSRQRELLSGATKTTVLVAFLASGLKVGRFMRSMMR